MTAVAKVCSFGAETFQRKSLVRLLELQSFLFYITSKTQSLNDFCVRFQTLKNNKFVITVHVGTEMRFKLLSTTLSSECM